MATNRIDFTKPHVIRNESEYEGAVAEMVELLDQNPAEGTELYDRLELITVLVAAYDSEHVRFGNDSISPEEVVDFVLEQQGLTRGDLARLMGGKSRVSEFFSGARALSMTQLQNLHTQLGIPAELLLPAAAEKARSAQRPPKSTKAAGVFLVSERGIAPRRSTGSFIAKAASQESKGKNEYPSVRSEKVTSNVGKTGKAASQHARTQVGSSLTQAPNKTKTKSAARKK